MFILQEGLARVASKSDALFFILQEGLARFASKNDDCVVKPALYNQWFAVTARGATVASGMVSFFPVLSQGTRAGKKDDTRLYKLPQTTLKPF